MRGRRAGDGFSLDQGHLVLSNLILKSLLYEYLRGRLTLLSGAVLFLRLGKLFTRTGYVLKAKKVECIS